MNAMFALRPYWHEPLRTWVFDDESRGLIREPFVHGVPEMIDDLTQDIAGARAGFRLLFSLSPFPGVHRTLTRGREDCGGYWYTDGPRTGWLCPAMFLYFPSAPETIYVRAEPLSP